MTKNKRFKVTNISENSMSGSFWLGKDNLSVYDIVRLLNELDSENQKLKQDCDNLIDDNTELVIELNQDSKKLKELLEENEKLKFQNSNLMKEVAEYSRKAKELEKMFKQNNRDIGHIYCKYPDQDFECPKVRVKNDNKR